MSISHGRLLHANYFLMRKITVTNILKKIKINRYKYSYLMMMHSCTLQRQWRDF